MDKVFKQVFQYPTTEVREMDKDLADELPLCSGVLSGRGALIWLAATLLPRNILDFATTQKELDGSSIGGIRYSYQPEVDSENFLSPCPYNKNVLIPTFERALVDYQRYDAGCIDDEHFTEAAEEYAKQHNGDFSKVFEVAEFYGCRPLMEEAIEIAKEYFR